jgi:hypothetical protein
VLVVIDVHVGQRSALSRKHSRQSIKKGLSTIS